MPMRLRVGLRMARQERQPFFFAKKNQKTFGYEALASPQRGCQIRKSFLVLFCKKELLSRCNNVRLYAA
jgi:hypothetical protein